MLCEVNLSGTAIGTGINTITGYAELACEHIAQIAGAPVRPATDSSKPHKMSPGWCSSPVC